MTPSPSPPSPYLSDPLVNSLKFMKVFLWGGPKMDAVHVHTFGFKSLSSITPLPKSSDAVSPHIFTGHFQRDSKSAEAKGVLAVKFCRLVPRSQGRLFSWGPLVMHHTSRLHSIASFLALALTKIFDSCQTWGNPEMPSEEDSSMLLQTVSNFNFILCEICLSLSKPSRLWNNPTNIRPHFKSHLSSQNVVT